MVGRAGTGAARPLGIRDNAAVPRQSMDGIESAMRTGDPVEDTVLRNTTLTLPRVVQERLIERSVAMNFLLVAAGSFLLAVSAQVAVPLPFTPVPLTLQPLAILLLGGALGSGRAAAAAALYLAEGALGLPVGAQGRSGAAWLVGPTAGYLFAFPVAAWIAGRWSELGFARTTLRAFPGMLLALAALHVGGWAWLASAGQLGARTGFFAATAPFLVGDVLKAALGAALIRAADRVVNAFSR